MTLSAGLNACEKKSYIFLRKELPVRLANIMKEIALLPDSLSRTPSVRLVSAWYARSFEEVLQYEKAEPTSATIEKYVIKYRFDSLSLFIHFILFHFWVLVFVVFLKTDFAQIL